MAVVWVLVWVLEKEQVFTWNVDFYNILKILHSTYIMHIKYSNLVDEIMRLLAAVLYLYYSTNMSALIPKLEIFMASHFSCVLCTYANEMETNAYCISCSSTSVEAEISM